MNDPYLNTDNILERLLREYKQYGKLIIAYDFDGTVFDFHNEGIKYPKVIKLLQSLRPYAYFIVYSASNKDRYPMMQEYLDKHNIPYDAINSPIENLNVPNGYKLYYNILLDDRAGLGQSVEVLEKFLQSQIKTYNFKDKNNATKITEELIKTWYEDFDFEVIDVSDIKEYQEKDIDLIAKKDNEEVLLEIKSDTYDTPNYFAEVISNTTKDTLGCWLKTKSDYIMYYFEKHNEVHVIPTKAAQEYVRKNYDRLKSVYVGTTNNKGKVLYYTEGKLVNKKDLQKAIDIDIFDLSYYLNKEGA